MGSRSTDAANKKILSMVAHIVSAHVRRNNVAMAQLPSLIHSVHDALSVLRGVRTASMSEKRDPAVSIMASVEHDAITCLECGQKRKMIREHLKRDHKLSPEAYRRRWDLPVDYAFTAPAFRNKRSALARQINLARLATKQSNDAGIQSAIFQTHE